jgi:hypothetical protein
MCLKKLLTYAAQENWQIERTNVHQSFCFFPQEGFHMLSNSIIVQKAGKSMRGIGA